MRESFRRPVTEDEVHGVAVFAEPGRQRAREGGLACAWGTEKFDDHIRTSFCETLLVQVNEAGLFMISCRVP